MKALVTLTPTESKKFIAKAIARMPEIQVAREKGLVVMHPSSGTYFLVEELTGRKPHTEVWMCGAIVNKGLCAEWGSYVQLAFRHAPYLAKPGEFPHSWIVKDGKMQDPLTIDQLCKTLCPDDVYVKSANALDPYGSVGVLIGSMAEGTIARISVAAKKRKFKMVLSIGLEKLIPVSIQEASKSIGPPSKLDYSMGLRCGLFPVPGIKVSEIEAVKLIADVKAVPVSSGGVGGAEGSIVLLISGAKDGVDQVLQFVEESKGAILPPVRNPDCSECVAKAVCQFAGNPKPWC